MHAPPAGLHGNLIRAQSKKKRVRSIRPAEPIGDERDLALDQRSDQTLRAEDGPQRPLKGSFIIALVFVVLPISQGSAKCSKATPSGIDASAFLRGVHNAQFLFRHVLLPLALLQERLPIVAVLDPPFRPAPRPAQRLKDGHRQVKEFGGQGHAQRPIPHALQPPVRQPLLLQLQ